MGAVVHLKGRHSDLKIIFSRVKAPACTGSLTRTVCAVVGGNVIHNVCRFDGRNIYS